MQRNVQATKKLEIPHHCYGPDRYPIKLSQRRALSSRSIALSHRCVANVERNRQRCYLLHLQDADERCDVQEIDRSVEIDIGFGLKPAVCQNVDQWCDV